MVEKMVRKTGFVLWAFALLVIVFFVGIGTAAPAVTIVYPASDGLWFNANNPTINYTLSGSAAQACWYHNETANTTIICGANITQTWAQGSKTIVIYANDSTGAVGNATRTFKVDTTMPNLTINSPANNTFTNDNTTMISFSLTDNLATSIALKMYLNGALYNSVGLSGGSYTSTPPWIEGLNSWYFNCTDEALNSVLSGVRNLTLDTAKPLISIVYPLNTNYTTNVSALNYTVSDANLQTCWYSLNGGANVTTPCGTNLTGLTSAEGSNTWKVWVNDSAGNLNFSSVTFFKDTIAPTFSFTGSEADASYFYRNSSVVNVTVTDTNFANVTVRLYNSTGIVNTTFSASAIVYLNYTNLPAGAYYYNATAIDSFGNVASSATRTFTIDRTTPTLNSISENPSTTSAVISYTASEAVNVTIKYGTSSTNLGSTKSQSSYYSSNDITLTSLSSSEIYYYNITICDHTGNCVLNGTTYHFETDAETSDDGGGDGGGGDDSGNTDIWGVSYYLTDSQFKNGTSKWLYKYDRMMFKINNTYHFLGLTKLYSSSATINVSSDNPQEASIDVGETLKFDVTDDNYYDVSITLNNISLNSVTNLTRANFTMVSINESMPAGTTPRTNTSAERNITVTTLDENAGNLGAEGETSIFKTTWFWVVIGVVVIALAVVAYLYRKKIRKRLGYE